MDLPVLKREEDLLNNFLQISLVKRVGLRYLGKVSKISAYATSIYYILIQTYRLLNGYDRR